MNQKFNELEDAQARERAGQIQGAFRPAKVRGGAHRPMEGGRTAVWQARMVLLIMINLAQLWILSATIEAALASHFKQLLPLVLASGFCWLIALSIYLWWKPVSRAGSTSGYLRDNGGKRR